MSELRVGIPLWLGLERNAARRRYRSLEHHIVADVVIVGGGLTGAVVAWRFAKAGVRVVVLETERVGQGSTAANSGLLMHEPDRDLGELRELYGLQAARRIWSLSRQATQEFIRTFWQLNIDCGLEEREAIYFTMNKDAVSRLRGEHHRRRSAGFGGRWLDAGELRRLAGISGAAGIQSRGNAQLNPYRACLGLLRSANEQGAHVFERSAVRRIERTSAGIRAITRGGSVEAKYVVIATGYAMREFTPLAARFEMKHTYVLATRPITARMRRKLGLRDLMLWDAERPYHYARWSGRRFIMGGADRPQLPARRRARAFNESTRALRYHFERLLPALGDVDVEYAWEGLFANTPDGLPYIGPHRRYPGHLFALGYGGNGMTFAFLAARLLLEWCRGDCSADCRLFAFNRHPR
jgi:glycine/D-amino acid oxidase-like deaminating enzyme